MVFSLLCGFFPSEVFSMQVCLAPALCVCMCVLGVEVVDGVGMC